MNTPAAVTVPVSSVEVTERFLKCGFFKALTLSLPK
jgi:hypothetical protein